MMFFCLCSLHVFILSWGRSALAATDFGTASASSPTTREPSGSVTPAPGGTGPTQEATLHPALVSMVTATQDFTVAATASVSEAPSGTTIKPALSAEGCLCDLTPDFCDIGCCCDTADCDVANLTTVFTGCPQGLLTGVCVEKWLMFRANVDLSLVTVTDTLFCVQPEVGAPQSLPILLQYPALGDSFHFSPAGHTNVRHSRDFYRVDDVLQTFFSNSSVRGLLRQPSPGAASAFCFNRNPAKFLRSSSLSCVRAVTSRSCETDPSLSARSYFSDMSLIKIPTAEEVIPSDLLIPVTPQAEWPSPAKHNNSCLNVVKKVEFLIGYTSRGKLSYGTVNVELTDSTLDQLLLQTHSVRFQLIRSGASPGGLIPSAGLRVGSPVIGHSDGKVQPLTTLGPSPGGKCSSDPSGRAPVLFAYNSITGCSFTSSVSNCTELRSQIYGILQGSAAPDVIAMNSGSQPDWTRVIREECTPSSQDTCDSGCLLPHSLSIQVLWARQGFLNLPQKFILGGKFLFHCQNVKCPSSSPLALTTRVTFVETTVYPEPPRGSPQPHWKFPFGFFTRGAAELDGHVVPDSSGAEEVRRSSPLLAVLLLTGLEFFTT
ncbi:tectonic-3 isoform X2 [Kryptolebias marmoratus]|uniref:tectonic-3 isoform X2 n=1 Tax=Kryptolebias marmoratus TaxID=37003 RepID=UPI0007F885A0|nr:tectonic-3 isoform X2 [Kryptolebias marmoratus]